MSHYVFSYGSNSTSQLQARVKNPNLKTHAATLEGYARVFCYDSKLWSGAVASICPCPGKKILGAVVSLTFEELKLLDTYEQGYRKEKVDVILKCSSEKIRAIVYVAGRVAHEEKWTPSLSVYPSNEYMTAIHLMLREHWRDVDSIDIHTANPKGGVTCLKTWYFPGKSKLSLKSFCVEINMMKKEKWIMPITISEFTSKMERVGVRDVFELYQALPTINNRLVECGEQVLGTDTLSAISKIPFSEGWVVVRPKPLRNRCE